MTLASAFVTLKNPILLNRFITIGLPRSLPPGVVQIVHLGRPFRGPTKNFAPSACSCARATVGTSYMIIRGSFFLLSCLNLRVNLTGLAVMWYKTSVFLSLEGLCRFYIQGRLLKTL